MGSMQSTPELGVNGAPSQGDQLQEAATGLLNQAARTADAQASTTMTKVGDSLASVSRAINDAAGSLRESQPQVADFVETAATKVDETARYLRERDASEVLETIQETARRQPALIIGGGLALGLVLGRILRTGAAATQGSQYGSGQYGSGQYGATRYGSGSTRYGATTYDRTGYGAGEAGYAAETPGYAAETSGYTAETTTRTTIATGPSATDGELASDGDLVADAEREAGAGEAR